MASIGTISPTSTTTAGSQSGSSASSGATDSLSNQNTFLQLLVAQLQYQDPTQPMDGTTFVTQLATFSDLQANVGTKTDLDAISKQFLGSVPSGPATSASGSTTDSGSTGTTSSTASSTGNQPAVSGS